MTIANRNRRATRAAPAVPHAVSDRVEVCCSSSNTLRVAGRGVSILVWTRSCGVRGRDLPQRRAGRRGQLSQRSAGLHPRPLLASLTQHISVADLGQPVDEPGVIDLVLLELGEAEVLGMGLLPGRRGQPPTSSHRRAQSRLSLNGRLTGVPVPLIRAPRGAPSKVSCDDNSVCLLPAVRRVDLAYFELY